MAARTKRNTGTNTQEPHRLDTEEDRQITQTETGTEARVRAGARARAGA